MTSRREFLQMLAVAYAATGFPGSRGLMSSAEAAASMMYDPPRFGNLSLLQIGDTHAQMLPSHVRESSFNMGFGENLNRPPYLVGEAFCEYFRVMPQTLRAHAHSHLYFEDLARTFGPTGGYAHLSTVIKALRVSRPASLLLDSGDTLLGSGLALWTRGSHMVEAIHELGVDAMTGDWEFALGQERLKDAFGGRVHRRTAFLACNVQGHEGDSPPFRPFSTFFVSGVPVGVIGQAYPHVGRLGAREFAYDLTFSLDEATLQQTVDMVRARGARFVVLLSHAGLPSDLRLAERIRGVDVIQSGHSHDAIPEPIIVKGPSAKTLVTSVGSHGKFVGVLDIDLRNGRMRDFRYRLLPIFSNLIAPDPSMQVLIEKSRAPFLSKFEQPLAVSEGLLYRRDNFMGSFDQLVLQALLAARNADVAFGPGYRWGSTILPGETITFEQVLDYLAIPDAGVHVEMMTGETIQEYLETWLDETFNLDPYQQSGDDMVRSLGLTYACDPAAKFGQRASDLRIRGKSISPSALYRVVSWGVRSSVRAENIPVWEIVIDYLLQTKTVLGITPLRPTVAGVENNKGVF